MRISVQLYCLWLCIAETTQLQCFYGRTNKTCEEGEVCFIRYEESFQSVFKKGCTKKEKYDLTLNKENTFFCSEDWCNDPSKYTDMTGELAQSGQLKCYSLTDGTVGDLITCPSGDEYCFVKMSFDSDITPTKIIGRFCGKNVGVGDYTLKKCQTNGCNNVALRSCYYGVAKTCDSSFEEYLSLAQFNGVQIKNCPHIFYPNVCVTRKLISSDNKTCVVHDCHHLEADHLLYFKRNPTAEELVMKDGNITMTITQCPKENCNEPSQRFKGIRCWVGDQGNCTKPLKFEQKNCPQSNYCYLERDFKTNCDFYSCHNRFSKNFTDEPKSCFNDTDTLYCRCSTDTCQKEFIEEDQVQVEISMAQKCNLLTIFWIFLFGFSFIFG